MHGLDFFTPTLRSKVWTQQVATTTQLDPRKKVQEYRQNVEVGTVSLSH
jgi:hypothetical protein